MVTKDEFISFCDSLVAKEEIGKYNKSIRNKWIVLGITWAFAFIITMIVYQFWAPIIFVLVLIVPCLTIFIIVSMGYQWFNFKKKYAHQVIDYLLQNYKHTYSPDCYIEQQFFNASGFGNYYNKYSGEDLLNIDIPNDDGTPSGVELHICDLFVYREEARVVTSTDAYGNIKMETKTDKTTIYNGMFGYVNFPFSFKCNLALNTHFQGEEKIKLEDVYFNKRFTTYTDNQVEALCILTPTMIRKLLEFDKYVKGFKIFISKSGSMYFGMSGNLFSLTNKSGKPSGKVFERFYHDIYTILSIVEEIKNNNKVFKM